MVMSLSARVVTAEVLDNLAADDAAAQRSRRDLQRIHRVMGTRGILLDAFAKHARTSLGEVQEVPLRVLELGAGDGSLLLGVAEALQAHAPGRRVALSLLDRQALVSPATIDRYARAGWSATACSVDVEEWVACASQASRWDWIVANLFLHHFEAAELIPLFTAIASRCDRFFACEPRRGWAALAGSHLVGALGANAVTRNDAVVSVRAGFAGHELSALWPATAGGWQLREFSAAPFSHCFEASRSEAL